MSNSKLYQKDNAEISEPQASDIKHNKKTRVVKAKKCRSKTTELSDLDKSKHVIDASPVDNLCDNQSRGGHESLSCKAERNKEVIPCLRKKATKVPVLSTTGKALMPCHPARAKELLKAGRAVARFRFGIFYIKLTDREEGVIQQTVCGIDPGSKREAFTVMSEKDVFINILSDASQNVSKKLETRKNMRKARRSRKTPCRRNNKNRSCLKRKGRIPPSTKSRWDRKINKIKILKFFYPISDIVIDKKITLFYLEFTSL